MGMLTSKIMQIKCQEIKKRSRNSTVVTICETNQQIAIQKAEKSLSCLQHRLVKTNITRID